MKTFDPTSPNHRSNLLRLIHDYCDAKLSNEAIVKETKSANLVIGDGMYLCSSLIADNFSLPHVTVLLSSFTLATGTLPFNIAENPSYLPQFSSGMTDNMNFVERAKNSLRWLINRNTFPRYVKQIFLQLKKVHNITPEKSVEQTFQKVDLILVQTEAFDYPRPMLPSKLNNIIINYSSSA